MPSTTPVTVGVTTFFVVEAQFAGGNSGLPEDLFRLYVNPVPGDPQSSTADATLAGSGNQLPFTTVQLYAVGDGSATFTFNELRIGSSWSAVTPVPESAASFILPAIALFAAHVRLRK